MQKVGHLPCKFTGEALGRRWEAIPTNFAAEAIQETADSFDVNASALDHAIWRYKRLRKKAHAREDAPD